LPVTTMTISPRDISAFCSAISHNCASVPVYVVSNRFVSSRLTEDARSPPSSAARSRRTSGNRCGAS
jgi:hypothetical protein